jgi:transposase InsO family protein
VLAVRADHPAWGGRKIRARLLALGHAATPAASTITAILHRHGLITPESSRASMPWRRFEHQAPNDLWQMDFKGPASLRHGTCFPLTILDDHSRYAVGLWSCADQRYETVRERLTMVFRRYGLPSRMLSDNGPPWGSGDERGGWTHLEVWLLKLGVMMSHGRPRHPQTQGKDERFHRTLGAEVLRRADLQDHGHAQREFDRWRRVYNFERPHEALGLRPPITRYRPSVRTFPEKLPTFEPCPGDTPVRVTEGGRVRMRGRVWYLGKAWDQEVVGLRASGENGEHEVRFGPYVLGTFNTQDRDTRVRLAPLGRCATSLHEPHAS